MSYACAILKAVFYGLTFCFNGTFFFFFSLIIAFSAGDQAQVITCISIAYYGMHNFCEFPLVKKLLLIAFHNIVLTVTFRGKSVCT